MDREIRVQYTPLLLRTAAWHFWSRYVGWGTWMSGVILLGLFTYFFAIGDRSWLTLTFGIIGALAIVGFIAGYFGVRARSLTQLRKMHSSTVHFHFTESSLSSRSDLGTGEVPWQHIESVWKFPTLWLLMVTKVNYITLPVDALDDELQAFITTKVRHK